MLQRLKSLAPLLVVIAFGVVCYLLSRELRHYTFAEIRDAIRGGHFGAWQEQWRARYASSGSATDSAA